MGTPLPLHQLHQALHAQLREEDGWEVVAAYHDAQAEHRHARRAAGLFDLSHRGRLEILGPDRVSWLHNLLTNDIKALKPGGGCATALLTPQGKVVSTASLFALPDSLLLDCETSRAPLISTHLKKYRITERVEVHDRTAEFGLLALQGPQAETIVSTWAGAAACPKNNGHHVSYHIDGMTVLIARCSVTGDPGFYCFVPTARLPDLWQRLLAAGRPFGLTPCGMDALESLRIEAGLPRAGRDFDETTLLAEAGLEQTVSQTKGCYVGQEFVVRIRDRGQVTRRLVALGLEDAVAAAPGDRLLAETREVGKITSSAVVPTHARALALGYVSREYITPGTALTVQRASDTCRATVITPTILPVTGPALDPGDPHPHDHPHEH